VSHGDEWTVQSLLRCGGDVNLKDKEGFTPLQLCKAWAFTDPSRGDVLISGRLLLVPYVIAAVYP